jgi:hypothetical protein
MAMVTLTTNRDLIDALAGWSRHVGWRNDGWTALAALGRLWRPAAGTLLLDGPTRADSACLYSAARQLSCLSDAGWHRTGERDTVHGQQLWLSHPDRAEPLHLVLRQQPWPVAAVQTAPPHLLRIPPLGQLLARRLQLIATLDRPSPAWSRALIDAAALASHPGVRQHRRYGQQLGHHASLGSIDRLAELDPATLASVAPGRCRQLTNGIGQLLELRTAR